jgi:hypothetical protein
VVAGCVVLDPGSAVLPGAGAAAAFGRLSVMDGGAELEIAHL